MMSFAEIWELPLETLVKVSDGSAPPSLMSGLPYNLWRSHNFTGTLEEKITRNGWRYLKFEVIEANRPDSVTYLAYELPEDAVHTYEVQE